MGIHQALIAGYPLTVSSNPTWSLVDSDFATGASSSTSVSNVQTGDFIFFTQSTDFELSISPPTGFTQIFEETDDNPSFNESFRVATTNEGTVNVTADSESEASGLMVFRCSTSATTLQPTTGTGSASGRAEAGSGSPSVPSSNTDNNGTAEAFSLCVSSAYIDDDIITSCTAPTGLTLAGFAGGARAGFFGSTLNSSLMVGYAVVASAGTTSPPGAGNSWTTNSNGDSWRSTAWYIRPS
tara:strand:+ start:348 stop:1067 length:720 start_codon:yes stop_codon:yes gene_type:complete